MPDQRTEFFCVECNKPVDLTIDLNADENGKAVHEDCCVGRLAQKHGTTADNVS